MEIKFYWGMHGCRENSSLIRKVTVSTRLLILKVLGVMVTLTELNDLNVKKMVLTDFECNLKD